MRGAREELEPTPRPPRVALLSACPPLHSRTRAIFTYRRCCSRRRATRTRQSTTPCAFGVRLHWLSMASRRPRVTTAIGRCCSPCGQCVRQCANRRRRQLCTGATRSSTWRGRSPGSGMARVGLVPRRRVCRASGPRDPASAFLPGRGQDENRAHTPRGRDAMEDGRVTLLVFGDSYVADPLVPRTWPILLADRLGWRSANFAAPGYVERKSAAQASDRPRLSEARSSLRHALPRKEASGEPAGRGLSRLVFDSRCQAAGVAR